jgi:hypothetical protein
VGGTGGDRARKPIGGIYEPVFVIAKRPVPHDGFCFSRQIGEERDGPWSVVAYYVVCTNMIN